MRERQQIGRAAQAFVVTVGDYSYCILKSGDGTYSLFDSHGSFRRLYKRQRLVQKASIVSFRSLEDLVKFVKIQRGKGAILAIAELNIIEPLAASQETECPRVVSDVDAKPDRPIPECEEEVTPWWMQHIGT